MGHLSSTFNKPSTLLGVLSQLKACFSLINPEEADYHYYLHFKDGKLRFRKVKCLTQGHEATNNVSK